MQILLVRKAAARLWEQPCQLLPQTLSGLSGGWRLRRLLSIGTGLGIARLTLSRILGTVVHHPRPHRYVLAGIRAAVHHARAHMSIQSRGGTCLVFNCHRDSHSSTLKNSLSSSAISFVNSTMGQRGWMHSTTYGLVNTLRNRLGKPVLWYL